MNSEEHKLTVTMFYDLNVPWTPNDTTLPRTLAFLKELGYDVVALNHTFSGKLPNDLTCPIPHALTTCTPHLTVLRRATLVLTDTHQNARLAALAREYDMLALRPVDERTLQQACSALDCDMVSLDLAQRFPFYFRHKTLAEAVRAGKRLELCYAAGLQGGGGSSSSGSDPQARRNVIANATQLIRASRGRAMVISSESRAGAVGCRGPWDVVNLAAVWGLGSERGVEAVGREARAVVVSARMKRTGWRGAVDVVYGGQKPVLAADGAANAKAKAGQGQKRKAEVVGSGVGHADEQTTEAPISKREAKRRAKQARLSAAANEAGDPGMEAADPAPSVPVEKG